MNQEFFVVVKLINYITRLCHWLLSTLAGKLKIKIENYHMNFTSTCASYHHFLIIHLPYTAVLPYETTCLWFMHVNIKYFLQLTSTSNDANFISLTLNLPYNYELKE